MAIENTNHICYKGYGTTKSVKHSIPDKPPANHDDLDKSVVHANKQLNMIKYYMLDYVGILKGCKAENKDV